MHSSSLLSVVALAVTALGAPNSHVEKRTPTVYLTGDSTMAKGNSEITGWGVYFPDLVSIPVINYAQGGESSRSYTVNNKFKEVNSMVKPNDIVIMEFGHNDGGGFGSGDNGRSSCPGDDLETTCPSTLNGEKVTVHTYLYYLVEAGKELIAKGAKVIVSSQTPNNPWESGSFTYGDGGRFVGYAQAVAKELGSNAMYVDHGWYTADIYKTLGKAETDALFSRDDHTHTNAKGADVVAKAFVKALQCECGGFLEEYIKNATESIQGKCKGE